jgi:catechol 2,3-dioxygenase-like lactoylglutathione lyase family enzyme
MAPAIEPSHLGICVSDVARSTRFYCDGLGFAAAEAYKLDSAQAEGLDRALEVPGPVNMVSQFITLDGMKIELLHFESPGVDGRPSSRRNQRGLTHLSFYVDDVDATAARLEEYGGTILTETRSNPGVELVFLTDPDGVRIELMRRA